MSVEEFAREMDFDVVTAEKLLHGLMPISIDVARRLEVALGGSTSFWIARDGQYRDDMDMVRADALAHTFPVAQMAALGWIQQPRDWHERIQKLIEFFGVGSIGAWETKYRSVLAQVQFRFARAQIDAPAVASWLRKAEIEAMAVDTRSWDPNQFRRIVGDLRALTRERDPAAFIPELARQCASVGAAFVVVRAPIGCPASGAARYLPDGRPMIVVTGRYRSDDHFWFTFFHEAAHILLHDPQATYVDEFEPTVGGANTPQEEEADDFAGRMLIPEQLASELNSLDLSPRSIARFARTAGTSPGIIVGQLQHIGRLGFSTRLNGFKRRYRWRGPRLEKA